MLISLPFLWMSEFTRNPNQCYLNMTRNDLAYIFCFNTLLIFIPTIGLAILYMMIIVKLKRRHIPFGKSKNLNQLDGINEITEAFLQNSYSLSVQAKSNRTSIITLSSKKCDKKTRQTIIISIVTVVFYCCQLPARLFLCWSYLNDSVVISFENSNSLSHENFYFLNLFSHIVTLIYFLHCISNPIIYNLLSSKFRKAFMSVPKLRKMTSFYLFSSKGSIGSNHSKPNGINKF